jgi:hypothetical protein
MCFPRIVARLLVDAELARPAKLSCAGISFCSGWELRRYWPPIPPLRNRFQVGLRRAAKKRAFRAAVFHPVGRHKMVSYNNDALNHEN